VYPVRRGGAGGHRYARLGMRGEESLLDRYFVLVPPL